MASGDQISITTSGSKDTTRKTKIIKPLTSEGTVSNSRVKGILAQGANAGARHVRGANSNDTILLDDEEQKAVQATTGMPLVFSHDALQKLGFDPRGGSGKHSATKPSRGGKMTSSPKKLLLEAYERMQKSKALMEQKDVVLNFSDSSSEDEEMSVIHKRRKVVQDEEGFDNTNDG